jgi:hypothetical protein
MPYLAILGLLGLKYHCLLIAGFMLSSPSVYPIFFIHLHYSEIFMVKHAILKSSVSSLQIIIYHVVLKVTSFVLSQK